jgi:adenylate cyclase
MPERTRSYRALFTTLVSALIGLLLSALSLSEPQPVIEIRNIIFDSFQRAAPRPFDPAMPARVVDIDDDSIQKYGQWPWPRTVLARLIEAIGRKEPLVIALDILLSEPDRASPDHLLAMLPPSPERDALELRLKTSNFSNDAILAETLSKYPVVAGMVMAHGGAPPLIRAGFAVAGDNPAVFLPKFSGAVTPIPVLQPVLKGVGGLNWLPEYDQVVRNIPTLFSSGDNLVPSLAVEALRVAQGASTIIVKASNASGETAFGRETGIVSLKIGQIVLPTDADGSLRPHYAGARAERRIPAWKVLEGVTARDELHGRIVFIGASASALADLRATPLNPVVPGVEVHAEVIEHALSGGTLARPDWAQGAEAVTTFLGAVLAGLAAYHLLPLVAAFGCLAVLGLMGYGAWTLFLQAHLLLNPALPGLAVIAAFAVVSVARWKTSDARTQGRAHRFCALPLARHGRASRPVAGGAEPRRRAAPDDRPVRRCARLHQPCRNLQGRAAGADHADEPAADAALQRHHRP